ncbi:hypothetical protein C8J57DRAFT_1539252 [Mycena rebaudengoi]|nr:hypothetical protein C8J57DRAFT_1539252 [Mycena rebaudengoi]
MSNAVHQICCRLLPRQASPARLGRRRQCGVDDSPPFITPLSPTLGPTSGRPSLGSFHGNGWMRAGHSDPFGSMYLTNSYLCFFAHMPAREDQVLKSGSLEKKARTKRWIKHCFCDAVGDSEFHVRSNQKTVKLSAPSVPSREEWAKAIRGIFKAQNMGDSVKIAIPYSTMSKNPPPTFSISSFLRPFHDTISLARPSSSSLAPFQNLRVARGEGRHRPCASSRPTSERTDRAKENRENDYGHGEDNAQHCDRHRSEEAKEDEAPTIALRFTLAHTTAQIPPKKKKPHEPPLESQEEKRNKT